MKKKTVELFWISWAPSRIEVRCCWVLFTLYVDNRLTIDYLTANSMLWWQTHLYQSVLIRSTQKKIFFFDQREIFTKLMVRGQLKWSQKQLNYVDAHFSLPSLKQFFFPAAATLWPLLESYWDCCCAAKKDVQLISSQHAACLRHLNYYSIGLLLWRP